MRVNAYTPTPPPSLGEVRSAWKEKDKIRELTDNNMSNQDIRKAMGFYIADSFLQKLRDGEI